MCWATFWGIFSQTHLATLGPYRETLSLLYCCGLVILWIYVPSRWHIGTVVIALTSRPEDRGFESSGM
jgi:hypothetical protein